MSPGGDIPSHIAGNSIDVVVVITGKMVDAAYREFEALSPISLPGPAVSGRERMARALMAALEEGHINARRSTSG